MISYNSSVPDGRLCVPLTPLSGTCTGSVVPASTTACLIDSTLAAGPRGYTFTAPGTSGGSCVGNPRDYEHYGRAGSAQSRMLWCAPNTAGISTCVGTETPLQ